LFLWCKWSKSVRSRNLLIALFLSPPLAFPHPPPLSHSLCVSLSHFLCFQGTIFGAAFWGSGWDLPKKTYHLSITKHSSKWDHQTNTRALSIPSSPSYKHTHTHTHSLSLSLLPKFLHTNFVSMIPVFFFQICEVGGLAITHKRTYPNLATSKRGK
jgi:hypothetical protein